MLEFIKIVDVKSIKSYFSSLPFFLLCLYILFMYIAQETLLPTIIHSVVMFCMIGVVIFCMFLKWSRNIQKIITRFTIWYSIFFIFCYLSAFLSKQSDPSILYPIVVSLVIPFCFIQTIDTTVKLEACLNVYIISALIMAFLLWQTGQLDYLHIAAHSEARLGTDVTGNANIFTALIMYAEVFAAWFMIYKKKKVSRLIYFLAFILLLFIMVVSGGRKTIIAVIGALSVFLILKDNNRKVIRNIITVILFITAIFIAILKIPLLYELIGERFEGLFAFFSGKESSVSSDSTRGQIFLLALKGWSEHPLFGHGIDSFKFLNRSTTGHFYYAHNNFAELLYDVGIIGFAIFYYMFFYIYRNLRKVEAHNHKYKVLGLGLLVELLLFDIGGVSYYLVGNIIILSIAYMCIMFQKVDDI